MEAGTAKPTDYTSITHSFAEAAGGAISRRTTWSRAYQRCSAARC